MGLPASAGTDPGMLAAAQKDMMAIMARRPLFNSLFLCVSNLSGSTDEKSIGGKMMVVRGPPLV